MTNTLQQAGTFLITLALVTGLSMSSVSAEDDRETLDGVTHILPEHEEHVWVEDEAEGQTAELEVDWSTIHENEDVDEYRLEGVSILDAEADFDNGQVGNFEHADTTYTVEEIDGDEYEGHYIDDEMYSLADLEEEIGEEEEYTVRTAIEGYDADADDGEGDWYFIGFQETTFSIDETGLHIEAVDVETDEDNVVRPYDVIDFYPQGVESNTELDDIRVDFYADTELEDEYLNEEDEQLSWYLSDIERNEDEPVEDYSGGLLANDDYFDDEEDRELPQSAEFTVMDVEDHEITQTVEFDHIDALDWNTVLEAEDSDSFEASISEKDGFEVENDSLKSVEEDAEATFYSVEPNRVDELTTEVEVLNDTSATVEVVGYDSSDYMVTEESIELEEGSNELDLSEMEGDYFNVYVEVESGDELEISHVKMTGTHQDVETVIGSPTGNFFSSLPAFDVLNSLENLFTGFTDFIGGIFSL